MTGILTLQNAYLSTTDPTERNNLLSELYLELIKLGRYILQIKKLPNPQEDIYDLASDVCCRLIDKQIPVIKSALSAYISSALFFKNKDTFHDSLEDVEEPSELSFEEKIFSTEDTEKLQQQLISYAQTFITNPFIFQLVSETITYQMDAKDVKKHLEDSSDRSEYSRAIRKIRQYLRDKTQEGTYGST